MEDSEARGEKARMEGYVRSDEGEAPGLVGEKVRSFQVMIDSRAFDHDIIHALEEVPLAHVFGKMCHTNFWRKILRASCSDPEFRRNQYFAQK